MNLQDLIKRLTEIAEEVGDDAEVRLAIQPSYPFQHGILDVVCDSRTAAGVQLEIDAALRAIVHLEESVDGIEFDKTFVDSPTDAHKLNERLASFKQRTIMIQRETEGLIELRDSLANEEDDPPIVYIAESGQVSEAPYLPGNIRESLGW